MAKKKPMKHIRPDSAIVRARKKEERKRRMTRTVVHIPSQRKAKVQVVSKPKKRGVPLPPPESVADSRELSAYQKKQKENYEMTSVKKPGWNKRELHPWHTTYVSKKRPKPPRPHSVKPKRKK